ncbi:MAG: HD domain-containing protein [Tepidisphaerales bacterium]
MAEKIIRDPVHDVITFRLDADADALVWRLLQTPEFQRLRRIRQLGLAHLAYPGADHARYGHSLGVMEMARRMLEQLQRSARLDAGDRLVVLAAALLHDLGHGPFSHVFERVSGVHHEQVTQTLLLDADSNVWRVLTEHDASLPRRVAAAVAALPDDPRHGLPPFLVHTLSSQLDADRLDYLLRDDLMTGSRYGQYDLQWLLRSLTAAGDGPTGRLAVSYKGVSAVEGYLQARYHMYRNVYFHKVVRSAEGMLRLALQRARRLAIQERLDTDGPALRKALLGQSLTHEERLHLDDVTLMAAFKRWTQSDDPTLARLCHGLLFRQLYKTVELSVELGPAEAAERLRRAVEAVAAAGGDPHYDLFYDEPSDTPYETVSADDPAAFNEIQVLDAAGRLTPFARLSSFAASLRHFAFRRVHVRAEFKPAVLRAVTGG